jgi:hypothetical protein
MYKTANKQVEKLAAEFSRCDQNLANAKPQKKKSPPTWVGGSILLSMLFRIYDLACSINLATPDQTEKSCSNFFRTP